MYHTPHLLTQNTGNNAFSYHKRPHPQLTIPSVMNGTLEDVKIGQAIVFEDFDEYDQLQSCKGLEHLVRFPYPQTGKPIIVVDNHNHVFWFWYQALHQKKINRGATLVHVDGHRDTRQPERHPSSDEVGDLTKLYDYTQNVLNVGNYIPPAMEEGLIGKLISITSEGEMDGIDQAMEGLKILSPSIAPSLIVNIDLDFWAPELDYIDREKKDRFARAWIERADLITFATSPFFIDQTLAIQTLKRLLEG